MRWSRRIVWSPGPWKESGTRNWRQVQRLEHEYADLPRATERLGSPEERQRILTLAQDLPTVWHALTTTNAERKRLLRFLIQDVTLVKKETTIHIGIRWQTEALTELEIPRPKMVYEVHRTDPEVVKLIRELSPTAHGSPNLRDSQSQRTHHRDRQSLHWTSG